jgi:N-acetylneuraminate synthase/N,N'-diacetyllegionaminate synthase
MIKIDNFTISEDSPVFIIAEAGVNHNGDLDLAIKLIDEAANCGIDCIKFQTFKADRLVTKSAPKANYQLQVTDPDESQMEMLKKLELNFSDYKKLIDHCKLKGLIFMSTPYNIEDIDFLDELDVPAFKVASGQLVELPFLRYMAKKGRPIILSTGMGYLSDVDEAVRAIRTEGNDQIIILQCTTNYPSYEEDANLHAMVSIKDATGCIVGYSDHTLNEVCNLGAVALGARVIEKHFTLDKSMPGPDHSCSADVEEFKKLVRNIRLMEAALGSGIKIPCAREQKNKEGMRRSLVARVPIKKGEIITEEKLTVKRPATGVEPKFLDKVIGNTASVDIAQDEILKMNMIKW